MSKINAINVRFHHLREQFRPNVIKNVMILGTPIYKHESGDTNYHSSESRPLALASTTEHPTCL